MKTPQIEALAGMTPLGITPNVDLTTLNISQIANRIRKNWPKVNFAAAPYLNAMSSLDSINDSYGYDTGKSIVRYFLSNASSFKGEASKAIKAELNRRLK